MRELLVGMAAADLSSLGNAAQLLQGTLDFSGAPELTTWGLMMIGFGAIALAVRTGNGGAGSKHN